MASETDRGVSGWYRATIIEVYESGGVLADVPPGLRDVLRARDGGWLLYADPSTRTLGWLRECRGKRVAVKVSANGRILLARKLAKHEA